MLHRLTSADNPPHLSRLIVAIDPPQCQSCARVAAPIELVISVDIPVVPKREKQGNAMHSVRNDCRDTLGPFWPRFTAEQRYTCHQSGRCADRFSTSQDTIAPCVSAPTSTPDGAHVTKGHPTSAAACKLSPRLHRLSRRSSIVGHTQKSESCPR